MAKPEYLKNLTDLRTYVHEILCDLNQLETGAFQMTERILIRCGDPCGLLFCLHGPRSVKLMAVWETDQNTILFYDSSGERAHRLELRNAPRLHAVAA